MAARDDAAVILRAKIQPNDIAHLWVTRPKVRLWTSFCGRRAFFNALGDGGGPLCQVCLRSPRGRAYSESSEDSPK